MIDETFMDMLKNKDKVIAAILADMQKSSSNMEAFDKLHSMYKTGSKVNTEKALTACAQSLRHLNDVNRRLLIIVFIYIVAGDYSSDVTKALVKLGRGQEAVREMFKQKFGGSA